MHATSQIEARLLNLAGDRSGLHVSIHLPLDAAADAGHRFEVRLANAARRAERRLAEAGADATERARLLRPILARFSVDAERPQRAAGVALFSSATTFEVVATPFALEERVEVGDHFVLRPLLPWLESAQEFRVLVASRHAQRLLVATPGSVRRLALPPIDADEGPATAERAHELEARSAVSIGGGAPHVKLVHAAAPTGGEAARLDLERYAHRLAAAVGPLLGSGEGPIVLAAPERLLPILRSALPGQPIVAEALAGSHDRESDEALRDAAWRRLATWREERRALLLARFDRLAGEGLALREPEEVVSAAEQGRVAVVLAAVERPAPGVVSEPVLEEEDRTVERALAATWSHGGSIETLPRDDMPGRAALAALLRW